MSNKISLEQLEQLATNLPPPERLILVAHICEKLSATAMQKEARQLGQERLRLAEELLSECEEIDDDSQGEFDVTEDIRRMRQERIR